MQNLGQKSCIIYIYIYIYIYMDTCNQFSIELNWGCWGWKVFGFSERVCLEAFHTICCCSPVNFLFMWWSPWSRKTLGSGPLWAP